MKLEDIKKMSNEEFIEFVNSMKVEPKETESETMRILNKALRHAMYIELAAGTGVISSLISINFTEDDFIIGTAFAFGTIVGIPIARKIIKYRDAKAEKKYLDEENMGLIQLKNGIENLTEEELLALKVVDNNNLYHLQDKIKDAFDNETNNFLNSLEPSYKDDEENLGYSKNIGKNN